MHTINALVEKYHFVAQFAFVYILEAHAQDEWPVPCECTDVKQHQTMQDRAQAAHLLVKEYPLHPKLNLLLDNIQNEFNNTYASWPFRYWIIRNGRVELKLMPEGDQTSMKPLEDWLYAHFGV
mmetsp:Transcript_39407/g.68288  ORF Transcript_39407/g.68288 Transcript_39407/m.68288 type:complete len:123 (-) Transcript_39407:52-420(-)